MSELIYSEDEKQFPQIYFHRGIFDANEEIHKLEKNIDRNKSF